MSQPPVDKQEMRARLQVRRRARSAEQRAEDGAGIARRLLAQPEVARARTVAAYVAVGTEPPTEGLLEALRSGGVRVLLPVLLPDLDVDWAEYSGPDSLAPGPRGLRQPTGPRLGVQAAAVVDVLLCPGLAVDHRGLRLGRGGGSYDRVLARVPPEVWTCVLLFADEVMADDLPADPHDQRVCAAATPEGVRRFPLRTAAVKG